jgi:hypothetical protein
MEKIQASKGHLQTGDGRQMNKSDKQLRRQKESKQARGTYFLKSADRWTS